MPFFSLEFLIIKVNGNMGIIWEYLSISSHLLPERKKVAHQNNDYY